MLKALVSTTTITETIRTPQVTQRAPISLPMGVLGVQSPQPTDVIVMTVIQAILLYIVREETEYIWYSAILNKKEKRTALAIKMVFIKEKGESLKTHLRQKISPGSAPYILQILSARADIYLLLMRSDVMRQQLRKMAKMMSKQLSLKEYSVS